MIDALAAHTDLCGFADRLTDSTDRSVAHNDAKLANFLFRDDRAICLVDLDTVMEGAAYFDVADLIRSGTSKADEDDPEAAAHGARAELVDAILDSYTRARSSTTPRENLEVATLCVVYEQALRFATDHVLGDAYYRTTRPRQNLDRARGQLVLLESLRVLFGR
ncbi:MAG: phosphotransferase [Actinobacteria bacterium]|nr:phosphotransferase [Actinomycetota bacterium]